MRNGRNIVSSLQLPLRNGRAVRPIASIETQVKQATSCPLPPRLTDYTARLRTDDAIDVWDGLAVDSALLQTRSTCVELLCRVDCRVRGMQSERRWRR